MPKNHRTSTPPQHSTSASPQPSSTIPAEPQYNLQVGGAWTTQRDRRDQREIQREQLRTLKVEWQDKLWLAQNHPCDDAVLAWLSENRAECSKIGSSRWHLETLPHLVRCQEQLRKAAGFIAALDSAALPHDGTTALPHDGTTVTHQPLTTAAALQFSPESPESPESPAAP